MEIITNLSSNSKTTRLPYIDNIKGFGMILVVLGHVINAYSTDESYNSNLFMDFVSIFYMKMFFFFSGFVYLFKESKCSLFIIESFKTLIWPCLIIWGGNMLGIMLIRIMHGDSPWFTLPKSEYIDFYWFCKCLFLSRIVLFLSCKLSSQKKNSILRVLFLNTLLVIILYLPIGFEIPWGFKTIHLYYVLGYVAKSYNVFEQKKIYIIPISVLLLLIMCIIRYGINPCPLVYKMTSVFLPIPIIALIHYIFKYILNKGMFLLTGIGKKSLMIYLLHLCILSFFYHILDYYVDRSCLYSVESWIIIFTFILIVSYLGAKYLLENRTLHKIIFLK